MSNLLGRGLHVCGAVLAALATLLALQMAVTWQSVQASAPALPNAPSNEQASLAPAVTSAQLYQDINAGDDHTCAVTTGGGVQCWGNNLYGQLGDGTGALRRSPVNVVGLASGAKAVVAGGTFSCALMNTGSVKCWGLGRYGALGAGSIITRSNTPVDVIGLSSVKLLAAGSEFACALTTTGGVQCWGANDSSQLGNGAAEQFNNRFTPVNVIGLASGATDLSTSYNTVCAVAAGAVAKCWGDNFWDQVGGGNTDFSVPSPLTVTGLTSGVLGVAAGPDHSCAVMAAGGVKCWGNGGQGELGNLDNNNSPSPVDVFGIANADAISAGSGFTCARLSTGSAECWGRDTEGQLGDGTQLDVLRPRPVAGLSNVSKIDAGGTHACALTTDHVVRCWGSNLAGQLGIGIPPARPAPVSVTGLAGVLKVVAGGGFSCALLTGSQVQCWGSDWYGTLGYQPDLGFPFFPQPGADTWGLSPLPVVITGVTGVTDLAAGTYHVCVVTTAHAVECWGQGRDGQLGTGAFNISSVSPVTPTGLTSGVLSIAGAYAETCAVMQTGSVKCWGGAHPSPTDVPGISNAQSIVMGNYDHCVLTTGGGVKCWGNNNYGQIGDGTLNPSSTPVQVVGLTSGVAQIAGGTSHVCALVSGGGLKCWGQNGALNGLGDKVIFGQLGSGLQEISQTLPTNVVGLSSGVSRVYASGDTTCAVVSGAVKCWGMLVTTDDGASQAFNSPASVAGLPPGVSAAAVGYDQECAVAGGVVKCWGGNFSGELGNGEAGTVLTPSLEVAPAITVTLSFLYLPLVMR